MKFLACLALVCASFLTFSSVTYAESFTLEKDIHLVAPYVTQLPKKADIEFVGSIKFNDQEVTFVFYRELNDKDARIKGYQLLLGGPSGLSKALKLEPMTYTFHDCQGLDFTTPIGSFYVEQSGKSMRFKPNDTFSLYFDHLIPTGK